MEFDIETWDKMLKNVRIPKKFLNELVLDYFINIGNIEAAETFYYEADIKDTKINWKLIKDRKTIHDAILAGQFIEAKKILRKIKLKKMSELEFDFLKQECLELALNGHNDQAIQIAAFHLTKNKRRRKEVEKLMISLAFNDNLEEETKKEKEILAKKVEYRILKIQDKDTDPYIVSLIKDIIMYQENLRTNIKKFPKIKDFSNLNTLFTEDDSDEE